MGSLWITRGRTPPTWLPLWLLLPVVVCRLAVLRGCDHGVLGLADELRGKDSGRVVCPCDQCTPLQPTR